MAVDAIFDKTSRILEKAMDLRMIRQGFIASNIANAETPYFRAVDVNFEATMEQLVKKAEKQQSAELECTDPRHFFSMNPAAEVPSEEKIIFAASDSPSIGNDSNSVNLESELGKAGRNQMMYSALVQLLNKKVTQVKQILDSASKV